MAQLPNFNSVLEVAVAMNFSYTVFKDLREYYLRYTAAKIEFWTNELNEAVGAGAAEDRQIGIVRELMKVKQDAFDCAMRSFLRLASKFTLGMGALSIGVLILSGLIPDDQLPLWVVLPVIILLLAPTPIAIAYSGHIARRAVREIDGAGKTLSEVREITKRVKQEKQNFKAEVIENLATVDAAVSAQCKVRDCSRLAEYPACIQACN